MFPKADFYGSATVGERGQIVIPVEVRNRFGIEPGDKLLVLAPEDTEHGWAIMLMDSSVLSNLFADMEDNMRRILERQETEGDE